MAVTVTARYRLDCVECGFEETVEGEYADVLEAVRVHQEQVEAGPAEHFVNVHRLD